MEADDSDLTLPTSAPRCALGKAKFPQPAGAQARAAQQRGDHGFTCPDCASGEDTRRGAPGGWALRAQRPLLPLPSRDAGPTSLHPASSSLRQHRRSNPPSRGAEGAPGSLEPRWPVHPLGRPTGGASEVPLTLQRVSLAHKLRGGSGNGVRRPGHICFWDVRV